MLHPAKPDEVTEKVKRHLARQGHFVEGSVFRRTLLLTIVPAKRHFWSPHLDVQLDEPADGGTRLSGTFGPQPELWVVFIGVQFLFALLSLAAGIWVISSWMVGHELLFPVAILGLMLFGGGFSYGAAYVGQGFGSEQMYELRSFLDAALRDE